MSPVLIDLMPAAKVVTLDNAGHELVITRFEEVAQAIVSFFNESPPM